ncbi:MAG: hypothetical protein JNM93_14415 [Bacteriovoracaceae bacterium]|nr:hypothetical protein [Bacteriovoracaceae bacterium]
MKKKSSKKANWTDLTAKMKNDTAVSYTMSSSYKTGDYINHTVFGLGYIESSYGPKISVVFEDKTRFLMQNTK